MGPRQVGWYSWHPFKQDAPFRNQTRVVCIRHKFIFCRVRVWSMAQTPAPCGDLEYIVFVKINYGNTFVSLFAFKLSRYRKRAIKK